ncbi:MAG: TonB-dependent receptor [Bacteroidetes bacterium]|nr:TonB-dependent receptor [Bacteroidota bacterium]
MGNPSLKPERSTSFEAGGGVSCVAFGEHHLDVTLFDISMRDRIIWVAAGSGIVTPKNLRDVRSRGLELAYAYSSGGAALSVHYTRSRSEKTSADYDGDPNINVQLPSLPQETAGVEGSYVFDIRSGVLESVALSGGYTFVGHRFVTEDNGPFLPRYHVLHAGAAVRFHLGSWRVRVGGDVGNLLDASYEVMPGYPMPLRNARLRCDVSY